MDRAIALYPQLETFLQQGIEERADVAEGLAALNALFPEVG
ncbi:MAG: hypothetical protein Q7J02_06305 [Rhodocyclaceae bacterium]|nr:hypothetical protein [Rhodocyclaceae bacterium]